MNGDVGRCDWPDLNLSSDSITPRYLHPSPSSPHPSPLTLLPSSSSCCCCCSPHSASYTHQSSPCRCSSFNAHLIVSPLILLLSHYYSPHPDPPTPHSSPHTVSIPHPASFPFTLFPSLLTLLPSSLPLQPSSLPSSFFSLPLPISTLFPSLYSLPLLPLPSNFHLSPFQSWLLPLNPFLSLLPHTSQPKFLHLQPTVTVALFSVIILFI